VDNLDETYLNGELLNNVKRMKGRDFEVLDQDHQVFSAYYISGNKLIPDSENVIAVRVYDRGGSGGIYEGPVGIVEYWKGFN
ncbi:MAG: hypothetical protein V5A51_08725, partial [Bacteroidales bacterium]